MIVADEPVSALDVSIQAQVVNLLEDCRTRSALTYLVIAHDLAVVRHICDTIGVMYLGALVERLSGQPLYNRAAAPLHAGADVGGTGPGSRLEDTARAHPAPGDLPSPANPPAGCRFHTRCP